MNDKPINAFPGYTLESFQVYNEKLGRMETKYKNMYRGEDVGFGGYVYAEPGMYSRVVCFDVSGMHPASIRALNALGDYTKNFGDMVDARTAIKHRDFDAARKMLGGKLAPYLEDESLAKDLAQALKIANNSVFGLTAANFNTPFRDIRNVNNQVALRGALFMVNLKHEVQDRGFQVIHCKTDSIKVVNPSEEISKFIFEYGEKYSYQFEIEHVFEKICLVNDAVYIAKLASDDPEAPGKWAATGKQFAVPYVFKTLFSREPIVFDDMCETFSAKKGVLYLDVNERLPDVSKYEMEFKKAETQYKKGQISDTTFESTCAELREKIAEGHDYHFVGAVGRFTPIKPGCGGAVLYRKQNDKYNAAQGTTGYRWMESEMVKELGKEDDIDKSYYHKLVDDAVAAISKYGDFEWFVSDDPYIPEPKADFMTVPENSPDEIPWEMVDHDAKELSNKYDLEEDQLPWD